MYLNNHPHFVQARGYLTQKKAERRLFDAVSDIVEKPFRLVVTRWTAEGKVDFVPVVMLTQHNMHLAVLLASRGIYTTSA